ncbi:MAG: glycosyltransferase family 9 protein, partial [Verrucomicrobiota bacterium]
AKIALIANCSEPDLVPWLQCCGLRGFLRYPTRWSHWAGWFANRDAMRPPDDPLYATGHAIDNTLAMAEALGLPAVAPEQRRLRLHVVLAASDALPNDLAGRLVIHPGASRADKQWPLERWARVGSSLAEEFGLTCALTGGEGERELAAELQSMLPKGTVNLAGELELPRLAVFLQKSALLLSGDTGPYHIAVATGCPSVTLFAPRDRGSSVEACGLHQADRSRHAELQTADFQRPISEIADTEVLAAARAILRATQA